MGIVKWMGQIITFTTQNNKQTRSSLLAVDGTDCPIDHQTDNLVCRVLFFVLCT
ncbi:hypothetical protein Hanom_Chr17g01579891 [Helianthus anomalus]